jgi:hypothetical protein
VLVPTGLFYPGVAGQRERIRLRQYDMSAHATEEMAEDLLDIRDVEHAILTGRVVRIQRDDPRGNKYVTVYKVT